MWRDGKLLLTLAILWCAGCSGGQAASGGGNTGGISVTVFPSATSVVIGQTVPFSATVTGTTNSTVNWEVAGVAGGNSTVGTITSDGLYTAPNALPNPSTVVVTAVSQADATKMGTGRVQVFQSNINQNAQSLPVKLGTSGGNADDKNGRFCCGGTLGSLLIRNGSFFILSNNHVLARSDQATLGEPISQPGIIETNCSTAGTTTVGNLTSFVNLQASGTNVDAAIALIVPGAVDLTGSVLMLGSTATGSAPDAGPPHQGRGIPASVGEPVAKSGRTTGLTCSTVSATDLRTSVTYQTQCNGGTSFTVTYSNQISVAGGGFSAGGDSGSLIVDEGTADPVALLYGGSDTDTVGNPVGDVLAALTDQQGNQPSFVGSASTHSVIGCTLAGAAVKAARAAISVDAASIALAQRAIDLHAPELLANPYISALGVAASVDRPGDAAVLIVVNPRQDPTPLPTTIEGVGTRIVAMENPAPHGILEFEASSRIVPTQDAFTVSALGKTELERAKAIHAAHAEEFMKEPGVQGVGITSSADAPGEAALMIYLIRGEKHNTIPAVIDGLRTRVRETSRFTAGRRGQEPEQGCRVPAAIPAEAATAKL
ncbi:MAG TPA: hypothetical protein VNU20_10140 [Candidatus Sulfotelmatobacter sp.]|jgi:hypothetical protein|nr:hypothetical protein [Candidatus Sulfotelmatobacter sp.]